LSVSRDSAGWTCLRVSTLRQIAYSPQEDVDLRVGVVEGERRADRLLHAEASEDRLGAAVPRADRDAASIEERSDLFRS